MVFTPEQQIFMIESYFRNGHTVHTFRESGSARPKDRTEENIDTVQRQMEDERRLSLGELSQQAELTNSVNLLKNCSKGS
jgi:hypothetical protein